MQWSRFKDSIKNETRFFNKEIETFLTKLFEDIEKVTTSKGESLIVDAGQNTEIEKLYRARVFQSPNHLEIAFCQPDTHLGPPPIGKASSGRMNAKDISVFYGASASKIAIAEVRPPVGSNVLVACFDIIKWNS